MADKLTIYVKNTSNSEGMPLQSFERLSPEWTGDSVVLPFGPDGEALEMAGWTDLFGGRPCAVHVVKARWLPHERPDISGGPTSPTTGYLVYGGNSGVRILSDDVEPTPGVDDHLPRGYGRPIVWVDLDNVADLPANVRQVVETPICEGCGAILDKSANPYFVDVGQSVYLCERCAGGEAGPDPEPGPVDYLARAKADLAALERGEPVDLSGWGVRDLRAGGGR